MTKIAVVLNAMLLAAVAGLPQLNINDDAKSIIGFICAILIAGLNAYLPQVTAAINKLRNVE